MFIETHYRPVIDRTLITFHISSDKEAEAAYPEWLAKASLPQLTSCLLWNLHKVVAERGRQNMKCDEHRNPM